MGELINKHTVKIQLTAALAFIGFTIYWTFVGTGYVKDIDYNSKIIAEIRPKVEKIPVIEANVQDIKDDLAEIKVDVKSLLKNR